MPVYASGGREKEKERDAVGQRETGRTRFRRRTTFRRFSSKPSPSFVEGTGGRGVGRGVGTFFIKVVSKKKKADARLPSRSRVSSHSRRRMYTLSIFLFLLDPIGSIFFKFGEKLVVSIASLLLESEKRLRAAFLSSKRELRFREQQVLTVPLCGARYGWRDIEGRTKLQRAALHAPRKLAIAYYIIHEWRSFRRADRRPTRFFAIRRDCEKQKRGT